MKINVGYEPSVWALEGDTFFCEHAETVSVSYVVDHMFGDNYYQTEEQSDMCTDCGEYLED